jgi:hypothetical protein
MTYADEKPSINKLIKYMLRPVIKILTYIRAINVSLWPRLDL